MLRCCRLLSITESAMLRSKVPDAASVSGGTGRCLPATNGHVRMNAAQVCWHMLAYADVCLRMLTYADVCINAAQSLTCSHSSSADQ
jgi:hypothetical protein